MRAIDVYFDAPRDARARAVLAARSSRTRLHRGIVLEAAHVQLGPAAVGVEGELWQPAARGSRWVCQGGQTSGWDRAVWILISVFIRYANSLPLEDYCHSNKEINKDTPNAYGRLWRCRPPDRGGFTHRPTARTDPRSAGPGAGDLRSRLQREKDTSGTHFLQGRSGRNRGACGAIDFEVCGGFRYLH